MPTEQQRLNVFFFLIHLYFKYINIFILLEWISLSSDLPDVIISICAGQLWTTGKIELLAKTWVSVWPLPFDWLLPFVWSLPFEWLLPFVWPLP